MSRSFKVSAFILVLLLARSVGIQAQMYSEIGSTGKVSFGSFVYTGSGNGIAITGSSQEARIIYNVPNPRDTSSSPSWTTLEILASDGGTTSSVQARLVRVSRFNPNSESTLCTAISNPMCCPQTPTTFSCTFSSSMIDFANYYYAVKVSLLRTSTLDVPIIHGIRVF